MRIRRIEVKDFRKLGHAVVEDLQDGLNVLVGDNETGKSTLLAALRAGLFERHRIGGEVAAAMLPYNQAVRPEVTIDFEIDGKPWRLRKAFVQRPEAELQGPGERMTGDAVEDRLAELFGFTPPGKGRSKPDEHQGVYGLLWVEQGGSHRALGVGAGRDTIASALEQEVGQVVGGERGRALLSSAEDRRNAFWDKRGNPRGPFKAYAETIDGLAARHSELAAALAAQDGKVSDLAAKAETLARCEREGRLEAAAHALAAAREALVMSDRLQAARTAAADVAARRRLECEAARDRKDARARLIAEAGRAGTDAASRAAELAEERAALLRSEAALGEAETALARMRSAARATMDVVRGLDAARGRAQAIDTLAALEERADAALAADRSRRDRLAAAAAIALEAEDLAALETFQADADKARLLLDATSVRIAFEPEGTRGLAIDGAACDPSVPLLLSRDAVLTLEGFGRLSIRPGGGVDRLAGKAEGASRALAGRLSALGFADLAAARAAFQARSEATREAALAAGTLRALAGQGLAVLLQSLADQRAALAQMLAATADVAWSPGALEAALAAQASARDAERAAEDRVLARRRAKEAADRLVATQAERAAGAARLQASLSAQLDLARADRHDDDLEARLREAEAAREDALRRETAAEAALAASDPETVGLELRRAEGAERAIRADVDTLRRGKRDLEIELKALGRDGIGEQLAEVEEQLAAGRRRLETDAAQARAARLLHDTLAQAQRDTRDRWLGPVRERAAPYLRLVQPDSAIMLNEGTLEIEGLLRKGVSEPFASLSVGAREQVAVITRIALADILRGAKRPSALILDDALVNTDEDRLHRMHLVLQRAGQSMQVLILTCRERDFVQLGAPIKRL